MGVLRRLVWLGVVVASLASAAVGIAGASRSAPTATPVHKLVPFPKDECLGETTVVAGKKVPKRKIVGRACVDYRFTLFADKWSLADGHATWDPGAWTNTFTWKVPQAIGPSAAPLPLTIKLTDKTSGRTCGGIILRGIALKTGESAEFIPPCAEKASNATVSESRTVHLLPPGQGPVTLIVGVGDGVAFSYRYVDASASPTAQAGTGDKKCGATRKPSAAGTTHDDPRCTFTVTYRFSFSDPEQNESASGHGKLRGPSVNRLDPLELASDDDENLIRWRSGSESIVFDVKSAKFRNTAKGLKVLTFEATVLRSNVATCPRGKTVTLDFESEPAASFSSFDCRLGPIAVQSSQSQLDGGFTTE